MFMGRRSTARERVQLGQRATHIIHYNTKEEKKAHQVIRYLAWLHRAGVKLAAERRAKGAPNLALERGNQQGAKELLTLARIISKATAAK